MTHRTDETIDAVDVESAARVGSVLKDTYELVGFLGEGGFGSVYQGIQHPIERSVAVKILDLPARGARKRFLREAKVVASLTHPAAVTIYDYGTTDDGCPFMVMEFLDGRDLEVELQEGPVSPARLAALLPDVLDALAEAHKQGLVHRDLKPSNLFVVNPGGDEKLKLLDFGIAGFSDTEPTTDPGMGKLTAQGGIVGTPQYLAPEYIRDQSVTPALDVYQMGLIIAEALSGTPAVNEPSLITCAQKHLAGELTISEETLSTPVFGDIVRRATATEPEDRYPDAGAMLEALLTASKGKELPKTSAERRMQLSGGRVPTVAEASTGPRTLFEDLGDAEAGDKNVTPAPPSASTPGASMSVSMPPPSPFDAAAPVAPVASSVPETPAPKAPPPTDSAPPLSPPSMPSTAPGGSGSSGAGVGVAAVVIGLVAVLMVLAVVVVATLGWYAGTSDEPEVVQEDLPAAVPDEPEIAPVVEQESIAGRWQLTTLVLGEEGESAVGVQGFYKLAVDSDQRGAKLTKTGFTVLSGGAVRRKELSGSERQTGTARLRAIEGNAFTLSPSIRSRKKSLDLVMVLVPNGETFSGYWQYRGKSYNRAELWGVLSTARTDAPEAPNAADQPCLVKCLVARQKLRPRSTPHMDYCTADCEGR